jgi:hypothetical protein
MCETFVALANGRGKPHADRKNRARHRKQLVRHAATTQDRANWFKKPKCWESEHSAQTQASAAE